MTGKKIHECESVELIMGTTK